MGDGDLIGIGRFAVLAGLSIVALRHYDEVGLLTPAVIDPRSGYRRYRLEQAREARVIAALRAVDPPIDAVRLALDGDEASRRAVLVAHRHVLAARQTALMESLATLDDYIENGENMANPTGSRVCEINLGVVDLDAARAFYEAVFAVEFAEERHGEGPTHLFAAFGVWPSDEFFLLNLSDAGRDPYRAGRADFGFLVDDLDAAHSRAIAAGGTELGAPADVEGMPRTSAIADPSGNVVNLYQNV